MNRLFWQAVLAFLALPGMVAFRRSTVAAGGWSAWCVQRALGAPSLGARCRAAALVRPRLLRGRQRDARAVGASAGTRRHRPVRSLAQSDVYRRRPGAVWLGGRISIPVHWRSMLSQSWWRSTFAWCGMRNRGWHGLTARNGTAIRPKCRAGFLTEPARRISIAPAARRADSGGRPRVHPRPAKQGQREKGIREERQRLGQWRQRAAEEQLHGHDREQERGHKPHSPDHRRHRVR